jgi:hypothetical protein
MPNRLFWAGEALSIHGTIKGLDAPEPQSSVMVRGVQSVGLSTTFNLDQVFQLGQLALYEDVEDIPDIEITVERVLNDDASMYILSGATSALTLTANQNDLQCDLYFSLYPDTQDNADDGVPVAQAHCSGMYVSSMSWTFPTDGNCTESFTYVGNGKKWNATPAQIDHTEALPTAEADAKVWRRQQIVLTDVPEMVSEACGSSPKIQSASISIDLGREAINQLGKKLPYYRYVTYPVEVTCELEVLVHDAGSAVSKKADGANAVPDPGDGSGTNVSKDDIKFTGTGRAAGGFNKVWDLGGNNTVSGISWGGGSTGGENATLTFSYRNFNEFTYTETAIV